MKHTIPTEQKYATHRHARSYVRYLSNVNRVTRLAHWYAGLCVQCTYMKNIIYAILTQGSHSIPNTKSFQEFLRPTFRTVKNHQSKTKLHCYKHACTGALNMHISKFAEKEPN